MSSLATSIPRGLRLPRLNLARFLMAACVASWSIVALETWWMLLR
jgi:hypothetical protein